MAILLRYDQFKFASAIAPVTDWRWYDATYTERYMDTPANAEDEYRRTSALTYIDKYEKGLRIIHGIIDDNVHPQHTLEFINKLMKTGKQFEMLIYPDQRHVFNMTARRLERRNELDYFMRMFFGKSLFETAEK
jgi:dipeptidyl-peptidase-4